MALANINCASIKLSLADSTYETMGKSVKNFGQQIIDLVQILLSFKIQIVARDDPYCQEL